MIKSEVEIITIKSEISELQRVEVLLKTFFERNKLPFQRFNKVFLCVSEAVINSIEHGNKSDCKKKVSIAVFIKNGKLGVEIKDEGEGFNYGSLPDPTDKKNLLKESGRGIHIMKSVADKLKYNDCGNSVQLKLDVK